MKDIRSFFGAPSPASMNSKEGTKIAPIKMDQQKNEKPKKKENKVIQPQKKKVLKKDDGNNKNENEKDDDYDDDDDDMEVGIVSNKRRKMNNNEVRKKKVFVIESSSDEDEDVDVLALMTQKSSQEAVTITRNKSIGMKTSIMEVNSDENDDEATTDEESASTKKNSNKIKNDEDKKESTTTATTNDVTLSKSKKPTKDYTKSIERKKEELKETSAEDYFATSTNKSKQPPPKKKTRILEMEEEENTSMSCDENTDKESEPLDVVKSHEKTEMVKEEADPVPSKATIEKETSTRRNRSTRNSAVSKNSSNITQVPIKPEEIDESTIKTEVVATASSKRSSSRKTSKASKQAPLKPKRDSPPISDTSLTSLCLADQTFVFTGILPNIVRDDAESLIKILGGRVTKAVSSKTTYLVCGDLLEDGRDATTSKKYIKSCELGEDVVVILRGEPEFYGLLVTLSDLKKGSEEGPEQIISQKPDVVPSAAKTTARVVRNPYAKKKTTTKALTPELPRSSSSSFNPHKNDPNALWADKYAPITTSHILGNGENVKKLSTWLRTWESTHLNNNNNKQRVFKAALLSGPPGIGKTTTAILVSKENNRFVREFNASDVRSKKSLVNCLGDITGSQTLNLGNSNSKKQRRVIIMDEVDGMSSGDRSGISEIISMIKSTQVPIICICNERQSPKLKSLIPYCLDLKYRRPVKSVIARRALEIASSESMTVESNALEALSESCGNDIRQVLNCMQMWSNNNNSKGMTFKEWKNRENFIKKDDILRLSMFDATKMILQGSDTLYKRSDAFFTDYNFMGLQIQQNYLKGMISQYQDTKKNNDSEAELKVLERMSDASHTMSDFAVAEQAIRGGNQNWELLPFCAILAVKTGRHTCGQQGSFFPGYPEFPTWLGKNSSRSKKQRLLAELSHHMNYNISTDRRDLRCHYIPTFYTKFMSLFASDNTPDVISLMDEYGLNRDDIFENINEFTSLISSTKKFSDFDSKVKASFTREYNKGSHKSQALVEEQGGGKKTAKRKATASTSNELDVVDDDKAADEEEEEEEEEENVKAFLKKGATGSSLGAKGSLSSVESGKAKKVKRSRKK